MEYNTSDSPIQSNFTISISSFYVPLKYYSYYSFKFLPLITRFYAMFVVTVRLRALYLHCSGPASGLLAKILQTNLGK